MADTNGSADTLILHEDGTVTIGWDDTRAVLRRPKARQWLSFQEESEAADVWSRGDPDADPPVAEKTIVEALKEGPYLRLYQRMLQELGETDVLLDDMPIWCATGDVFRRISGWWWQSPLARSEATQLAAALRTNANR